MYVCMYKLLPDGPLDSYADLTEVDLHVPKVLESAATRNQHKYFSYIPTALCDSS